MSPVRWSLGGLAGLLRNILRWSLLGFIVGALVGGACAFFLLALDRATGLRLAHPWLLWLLPVAGLLSALLYKAACGKSQHGNNLIIEEIHEPGGGVPARMGPLVLFATLASHLTGASVGREGTAVQMGGSIAGWLARRWKWLMQAQDTPTLLMTGVAAGFGGVFGTPLAGAVFAAEVLTRGSLRYRALGPCVVASFTADFVTRGWGVHHTDYGALLAGAVAPGKAEGWPIFCMVLLAGVFFGLAAAMFITLAHAAKGVFERIMPVDWLRPAIGGLGIIALTWLAGTTAYLGLGVDSNDPAATTIQSCFFAGGAVASAWLWKTLFTAVSVGSGLKGGEVTPLFFIGAALGNVLPETFLRLGTLLHVEVPRAPAELFAALGFVAVFAAAANTPLACILMALEIFGPDHFGHFALACFAAYVASGKTGIYSAQRK